MNNEYLNKAQLFGQEIPKCRCCGNPITWDNSDIYIGRDGSIKYRGKTHNTTKSVNNTTYHLQVCGDCYINKYGQFNPNFGTVWEGTKWAFNIDETDYVTARKKYAMTESHMIEKYGEDVGRKKWTDYCAKQAETNTFEYKKKIYGWTKEQFDEYNKSRAVTLNNLIKRYGEDVGRKKWTDYCAKQRLTKSWDYLVEKYGEQKARSINRSKAITLQNMIKVHGEQKGRIKYSRWLSQFTNREPNRFSKTSQRIFNQIKPLVESEGWTCKYQTHGGEQQIVTSTNGYFLDFYIPEIKVAIEYNGGVFHGDPRLYDNNEHCDPLRPELTAKEIREHDQYRYNILYKECGIKTYIIWELDFQNGLDIEEFVKSIINEYKKIHI